MLNIYFGDMKDAIYNTSVYFNNTYLNSWLDDPFAVSVIKNIEKGTILSGNAVDTKALGIIPVQQISGGTKTLLLIRNDRKKVFNASTCGDNCAKWLLKIAKESKEDITINLHHIMDFGNRSFEIRIANTGDVVHNMTELVPIAGALLEGGAAQ